VIWNGCFSTDVAYERSHDIAKEVMKFVPVNHQTRIQIAFNEAICNAIKHAKSVITVYWHLDRNKLTLEVSNDGWTFHPKARHYIMPDCDIESGRGIPIMRRCCDKICYLHMESGTRVNIIWRLDHYREFDD